MHPTETLADEVKTRAADARLRAARDRDAAETTFWRLVLADAAGETDPATDASALEAALPLCGRELSDYTVAVSMVRRLNAALGETRQKVDRDYESDLEPVRAKEAEVAALRARANELEAEAVEAGKRAWTERIERKHELGHFVRMRESLRQMGCPPCAALGDAEPPPEPADDLSFLPVPPAGPAADSGKPDIDAAERARHDERMSETDGTAPLPTDQVPDYHPYAGGITRRRRGNRS